MTEECNCCGKEVTKYVLFEIAEIDDVLEDDAEIKDYYAARVCNDCGKFIRGQIKNMCTSYRQ